MFKQTPPSLVMKVSTIENEANSLTHQLDIVTQQQLTDALSPEFITAPRVNRSGTKYITL